MTRLDSNCDLEALAAWIDGRLEGPELQRLLAHTAACPSCAATVATTVTTLGELELADRAASDRAGPAGPADASFPVATAGPDDGGAGRSEPAAARPQRPRWRHDVRWRWLRRAAVASVVLGAAGYLGWLLSRPAVPEADPLLAAIGTPLDPLADDRWRVADAGRGFAGSDPSLDVAVTSGAWLFDLVVARRADSAATVADLCRSLEATVGPVACLHTTDPTALKEQVVRRLVGGTSRAPGAADAEAVARRLELGQWLEAVRLAARHGRTELLTQTRLPAILSRAGDHREARRLAELLRGPQGPHELAEIAAASANLLVAPPP
jgi:hypothetical protein